MLKVNFLSEFFKFRKILGANGALTATMTQADEMQNYVKVIFNSYGNGYDLIHSHGCFPLTFRIVKKAIKLKKPIVISAHQTHYDTDNGLVFSKQLSQFFKIYLIARFKFE